VAVAMLPVKGEDTCPCRRSLEDVKDELTRFLMRAQYSGVTVVIAGSDLMRRSDRLTLDRHGFSDKTLAEATSLRPRSTATAAAGSNHDATKADDRRYTIRELTR